MEMVVKNRRGKGNDSRMFAMNETGKCMGGEVYKMFRDMWST